MYEKNSDKRTWYLYSVPLLVLKLVILSVVLVDAGMIQA